MRGPTASSPLPSLGSGRAGIGPSANLAELLEAFDGVPGALEGTV